MELSFDIIDTEKTEEIHKFADEAIKDFKSMYSGKPIPQFIQDMIRNAIINTAGEFYCRGYNNGKSKDSIV